MGQLADRLEGMIRREAPSLHVQQRWGHPWLVGNDLVCLVGAFSHHVGIEFWRGSALPDPDRLLEGTGKNLRHVKVRTAEEADSPRLKRLLPGARTGPLRTEARPMSPDRGRTRPRRAREPPERRPWLRYDRVARSVTERLQVRPLRGQPFWLFAVRNPVHHTKYQVALPEFPADEAQFCSCGPILLLIGST